MTNETYERVASSPLYHELVQKRNRFSLILSVILLVIFYTFVLFTATDPKGFAAPITEGSRWATGHIFGWAIHILSFAMTGIYVYRANSEFDALNSKLIEEAVR